MWRPSGHLCSSLLCPHQWDREYQPRVYHVCTFACALPQGRQLHTLPRAVSATGSSPAQRKHLRVNRFPTTTKGQRGNVLLQSPLRILDLLCAAGRESLVLQKTAMAGVTKIKAFMDYKGLDSTCSFFAIPKRSQPLPSDAEEYHQDC